MAYPAVTVESLTQLNQDRARRDMRRGIRVFNAYETMAVNGYNKRGEMVQGQYEIPFYRLTLDERIDIARSSSIIFGLITTRMNKIAGLDWKVSAISKEEDRIADTLKQYKQVYSEYKDVQTPAGVVLRAMLLKEIRKYLIDVKPDLSNFNASLLRWSKRNQMVSGDRAEEIEQWLTEPNMGTGFEDFIKETVFDLMVHGAYSIYKEYLDGKVENFYNLPGGTIFPMKSEFVGGYNAFAQIIYGFDPRIYFGDEVSYGRYVPFSGRAYGLVPLEALVNKIAENLLFDEMAASRADGTKPPEKLVVFNDYAPFGGMNSEFNVPLEETEQKKIETVINEERRNAVRILSGYGQGQPTVVDVSRSDTFASQSERQRMIREEMGFVFNVSNMEMNLTGGESTSGRSTSESQERIENSKGVQPIVQKIEHMLNREILPFRFGSGFEFHFDSGMSEMDEIKKIREKINSGAYAVNEVRVEDMGKDPFDDEQFDLPQGAAPDQLGEEGNPMNIREML